ncbi:MAG: ABC transporter permease, partial [Bacteroidales bacterium]|nr:ABC transporter permease [Bacteroidales bacterium]
MFRNFFILAIRNLLKNKAQSIISITGLAVGFSVFIMIGLYLKYEYSWDKHNELCDRIYRVQQKVNLTTGVEYWTQTQGAIARHLREHYPEVENSVVLREAWGEFLSSSEVQTFYDGDGYYAEQSLFDIFTYEFVKGNKAACLLDPYSIVLSEKMAGKLFPHEDALGKNILLEKKYNLRVTGIYKELPENSMVRPSYIIPIQLFEKTNNWENALNNWTGSSFRTYVLLKQGSKKEMLDQKIVNLLDDYEVLKKRHKLYLLPLKDVFLHPG